MTRHKFLCQNVEMVLNNCRDRPPHAKIPIQKQKKKIIVVLNFHRQRDNLACIINIIASLIIHLFCIDCIVIIILFI